MKFRPCIDIHNGRVKQLVGGSLRDQSGAEENFVSSADASFYGRLYRKLHLTGGHIILLNPAGTPEYTADLAEAEKACAAYPDSFLIGGGVTAENARDFLAMGARKVVVTSYIFQGGQIDFSRLQHLSRVVGREHLALDLSCRNRDGEYYVVTDRWQHFTDTRMNAGTLTELSNWCSEYLIHAVDAEGKKQGVDKSVLSILASWEGSLPITYAGGVSSFSDLSLIRKEGRGKIDVTIGSALSLFGGSMDFDKVLEFIRNQEELHEPSTES